MGLCQVSASIKSKQNWTEVQKVHFNQLSYSSDLLQSVSVIVHRPLLTREHILLLESETAWQIFTQSHLWIGEQKLRILWSLSFWDPSKSVKIFKYSTSLLSLS